jgi:uroporphyrinogen-III synthase
VGKRTIQDLAPALKKHNKERFLLPCSNLGAKQVSSYLKENKFDWQDAMMYQTISSDLSDLSDVTYDVLVFFSPLGIKSLYENFPDFEQQGTRMAIFGNSTSKEVEKQGLTINIKVPAPGITSMATALGRYLEKANKSL